MPCCLNDPDCELSKFGTNEVDVFIFVSGGSRGMGVSGRGVGDDGRGSRRHQRTDRSLPPRRLPV